MRFNWKNFKAGKIEVVVKNQEEYNEFMQRCEKKGFKWHNGNTPTQQNYLKNRNYIINGGFGVLRWCNEPDIYIPAINYSEFALPTPADVQDRAPTLEELAAAAAILAVEWQKTKEAFTAARAAICDAMAQFGERYAQRLQELKKEQSDND